MRLAIGLVIVLVAAPFIVRRLLWIVRLIRSGQPVSGRLDNLGERLAVEVREVMGQSKLLKWSVPGLAHFFTMWGFTILLLTIIELFGGAARSWTARSWTG